MSAPTRRECHVFVEGLRSRGFTLIEVLIATVIIALGSLGLLALFAGAAAQQQASSRTTLSSFVTSAAESTLIDRFGAFAANPESGGNPSALAAISDGVWRPLTMDVRRHTLLTPEGTYSLVDASSETLFTFPVSGNPDVPGQLEEPGFLGGEPSGVYASGNLINFGNGDVEPDSLTLTVSVTGLNPMNNRVPVRTYTYSRIPGTTYDSDDAGAGRFIFPLDGQRVNDPRYQPREPGDPLPSENPDLESDYIIVDVSFRRNQTSAPNPARIYAMRIRNVVSPGGDESRRIENISVEYKWRDEQLLTLRDRIIERPDTASATGTRPDLSYSVLFKRDAVSGTASAAILVYQLTPASSRSEYLPPELVGDMERRQAPIRRAEVTLGEIVDQRQQFIRTANANDAWITASGQIVIFEGNPGSGTPGADGVYRVVRQEVANGVYTGYLDRAPRFRNRAIVSTSAAQSGQTVQVRVLGVAESVRSRSDGSAWTLRPVDARVFQVPISQ